MDPFVVDASLTLSWCFADEATPYSRSVLAALDKTYAVVPALWPFEVANVLALAERHQRITRKASQSRQCYPLPASDGSVGTMRPISTSRDESACTWPHWIAIYRKLVVR